MISFSQGSGLCLIFLPSIVILLKNFDEDLSLVSGLTSSGTAIGSCVFPFLVGYLLDVYGLSNCLFVMSAFMLNGIVFASLYIGNNVTDAVKGPNLSKTKKAVDFDMPVNVTPKDQNWRDLSPYTAKLSLGSNRSYIVDFEGSFMEITKEEDKFSISNSIGRHECFVNPLRDRFVALFALSQVLFTVGNGFWSTFVVDCAKRYGVIISLAISIFLGNVNKNISPC